jgi:hypothetical protein
VDPAKVAAVFGPRDSVAVSCDVQNTGAREGTEVVQVYVRDVVASVTTPHNVMALKAFARVQLEAGQKKTVRMEIDVADQLQILNRRWEFVVEPGLFQDGDGGSGIGQHLAAWQFYGGRINCGLLYSNCFFPSGYKILSTCKHGVDGLSHRDGAVRLSGRVRSKLCWGDREVAADRSSP